MTIKLLRTTFFLLMLFSLSSFKGNTECQYAGANIDFVKSQTEKALEKTDINILKYHAYKAINAIQKTEEKLSDCGCKYAVEDLQSSLTNLKLATKEKNLEIAKDLLSMSLESTKKSLVSLEEHEFHKAMDNEESTKDSNATSGDKYKNVPAIYRKIDESLEKYRKSLNTVVETVNCKEAHDFARKIVEHCEHELLNKSLTDGKKYYYLRTKEITANALKQLNGCGIAAR